MTKGNILKTCFVTLLLAFCLNFSNFALAGDCADKNDSGGTQTVYGNYEYTPEWFPPLQYDPANPQTIQRNQSVAINVIGGFSPYTWSVSGTGFTLASETTTGLSNTLNVDAAACGGATVTVTGYDGNLTKGYVACTTGTWCTDVEYLYACGTGSPYFGCWCCNNCPGTCGSGNGAGYSKNFDPIHRVLKLGPDCGCQGPSGCGDNLTALQSWGDGFQKSWLDIIFNGTGSTYGCWGVNLYLQRWKCSCY